MRKARQQQQHNRNAKQHNTTCPKQSFFNEKLAVSSGTRTHDHHLFRQCSYHMCTVPIHTCMYYNACLGWCIYYGPMHIMSIIAYKDSPTWCGWKLLISAESVWWPHKIATWQRERESGGGERERAHGQAYVHIILVYSYMHTCPCIHVHTCLLEGDSISPWIKGRYIHSKGLSRYTCSIQLNSVVLHYLLLLHA